MQIFWVIVVSRNTSGFGRGDWCQSREGDGLGGRKTPEEGRKILKDVALFLHGAIELIMKLVITQTRRHQGGRRLVRTVRRRAALVDLVITIVNGRFGWYSVQLKDLIRLCCEGICSCSSRQMSGKKEKGPRGRREERGVKLQASIRVMIKRQASISVKRQYKHWIGDVIQRLSSRKMMGSRKVTAGQWGWRTGRLMLSGQLVWPWRLSWQQVCSFKGPARETDQKWAKRPCRHVTAANAGSKSVFRVKTFASWHILGQQFLVAHQSSNT